MTGTELLVMLIKLRDASALWVVAAMLSMQNVNKETNRRYGGIRA